MSLGAIYILTPTIGWATPLVWPIVFAVAGALGYNKLTAGEEQGVQRGELNEKLNSLKSVTLRLEQVVKDLVSEELGRDQVLRFVKDDIVLMFRKDERGHFSITVWGPHTKTGKQLEIAGMEFAAGVVQQFSYNKMAAEMERRGGNIIGEEVTENGDIVLKLRRWP